MVRNQYGREKGVFFEQVRRGGIPDPYMPRKGFPEPAICPSCQAIYHKKRWVMDEKLLYDIKKHPEVKYHKCPACRKIEDHFAMGLIELSGDFVIEHKADLINLIKSEEKRAMEKNPLERIISIDRKNDKIEVAVTTDSLALRIGRVLERAYKGKSDYKFRSGDKYVTVHWKREEGK